MTVGGSNLNDSTSFSSKNTVAGATFAGFEARGDTTVTGGVSAGFFMSRAAGGGTGPNDGNGTAIMMAGATNSGMVGTAANDLLLYAIASGASIDFGTYHGGVYDLGMKLDTNDQLNMLTHKITGLANGSSAQDAAAFGQIASGINAAVSGTSTQVAVFNGPNSVTGYTGFTSDSSGNVAGNSFSNGASVLNGTYVQSAGSIYVNTDGRIYLTNAGSGSLGGAYGTNATASVFIDAVGYAEGTTQYRDLHIQDGKGSDLIVATGSTKAVGVPGSIGIGIAVPSALLHISQDGDTPAAALVAAPHDLMITSQTATTGIDIISTSTGNRAIISGVLANGTLASPTVASSGDKVFSLIGKIYDGTTIQSTAAVEMFVDGAISSSVAPQRIEFLTGATNSRTERMRIDSAGLVHDFGTLTVDGATTALGDVVQSAAAATSGTTLVDSPEYHLRATYWDGAASQNLDAIFKYVPTATTPTAGLRIYLGPTGSPVLAAILSPDAVQGGDLDLQNGQLQNIGGMTMKAGVGGTIDMQNGGIINVTGLNSTGGALAIGGSATVSAFADTVITASIASTVDDWNPAGIGTATAIYVTSTSGTPTIDGIVGGIEGRRMDVCIAANTITSLILAFEASGSTSTNRLNTTVAASGTQTIWPGMCARLHYTAHSVSAAGRWVFETDYNQTDVASQALGAVDTAVSGTSGQVSVFNSPNSVTGYTGFTSDSSGNVTTARLTTTGLIIPNGTAMSGTDISSCGTGSPAMATGSTDQSGQVTEGTTATGCTVALKQTHSAAPFCTCTIQTVGGVAVACSVVPSTSALVFTNASATGDKVMWTCLGPA